MENEYISLSDAKVKAAVQMEGFVCFVFTVHLKVSGMKMKPILSFEQFTYEVKTTLGCCYCVGYNQKTRLYPIGFSTPGFCLNLPDL